MNKQNQNYFPAIDGLRGVLILFVMAHHFALFFQPALESNVWFNKYASIGYLAVRSFFIVSGFLIYHQMKNRADSDPNPKINFYIRRFFRIFPLWILILVTYLFIYDIPTDQFLINLTFLFGFKIADGMMLLPQSWSLFVEEIFYLIFPWIYKILNNMFVVFTLFIVTYLISYFWKTYAARFGVPPMNYFIEYFPLAHLHYFLIGILSHHFLFSLEIKKHLTPWQKYIPRRIYFTLLVTLSYLVFLPLLANEWPVLFCALPFFAALSDNPVTNILFKNRFLKFAGLLCYPLYLIHMLLLVKLSQFTRGNLGSFPLASFGLFILSCLIISFVLHILVEKPMLALGKNRVLKNINSKSENQSPLIKNH